MSSISYSAAFVLSPRLTYFFPFSSCQFSTIGPCGVKCPFPVKSEEGKHTGCISSLSGKISMVVFSDRETHFLLSSTSFSFLLSYAHPIGLPLGLRGFKHGVETSHTVITDEGCGLGRSVFSCADLCREEAGDLGAETPAERADLIGNGRNQRNARLQE